MKAYIVIFTLFSSQVLAQHSFKVGTQIPFQYAIQYDYQFHPRWSANVQGGVLTTPYDKAILGVMQSLGVDQPIINVITNTFSFGIISQAGVNYHFKKYYIGLTGSWIHLQATDVSLSAMETAFNVSINSYPTRPRQTPKAPVALTLSSDLYNTGILCGKRFTFKNPKVELHAEFSFSKVIGSSSVVDSEQKSLESLSKLVDEELKSIYIDYGYIPTINIYFVYKLGKI